MKCPTCQSEKFIEGVIPMSGILDTKPPLFFPNTNRERSLWEFLTVAHGGDAHAKVAYRACLGCGTLTQFADPGELAAAMKQK
jgi:hypothetical protein